MASNSLSTSYLLLTGVILISLVVIFTVIQPLASEIASLRQANAATAVKAAQREAFLRTLDQKISALTRQAQHEQQLNVVLPVSDETEDVVRIIHQAERTSGGIALRLNNISTGLQSSRNARQARGEEGSLPDKTDPLGFEIDFAGSYQQLRVFLGEIQRAPRLMDVVSLEIRRNTQVPDSVTATLIVQFYRYGPT